MTREDAIKIVRNIYQTDAEKEALATLIPELAESEDERIRKDIIAFLQSMNSHCNPTQDWDLRNRWLPYLEKQKEQKPNIEHIQRSWYMEGYLDGKFGEEPRWIIETDDGGPRYENNPRHGEDKKEHKTSKPKTSIEILKHYLAWATNDDSDCPYTWAQLANAIKDGIAALEQKPAEWSEDERIRKELIGGLMWQRDNLNANGRHDDNLILPGFTMRVGDLLAYLEKQKEQKPAEWSEEDKRKLNRIYEILGHAADDKGFLVSTRIIGDKEAVELQDFLESLRPRPHWKPSKEQMVAMKETAEWKRYSNPQLFSLYEDLKKLM